MKRFAFLLATAVTLGGGAQAADIPTKKAPEAAAKPSCWDSFSAYLNSTPADCPLTWQGITLYGQIDVGAGYSEHAATFNRYFPQGVQELISKYSRGGAFQLVPNGLSQSNVGLKIKEELLPGWSIIGDANLGFDPYSLQLANGPKSLVQNNNQTILTQSANGDSSRAGQWDNSRGYLGLSNSTFGALTFGRQNALSNDLVTAYDPMGGSYAFSLIGNSSTYVSGVGDTETARYNTSVKYQVKVDAFRAAALAQLGGYQQGNGSDRAYQFDIGADYAGFSVDALYSYARDAVSLSTYSANPLPKGVQIYDLKATLANIHGGVLAAKYVYGPVTGFGGYGYARFTAPSDAYPTGIGGTLGGYSVLPAGVSATTYSANAKVLQTVWIGAKYAARPDLDLSVAYYYAHQNAYLPAKPAANACAANTSKLNGQPLQGTNQSYCAGSIYGLSALVDYRPVKRIDLYAGLMLSNVSGGIASGYLHTRNVNPTAGLRISF